MEIFQAVFGEQLILVVVLVIAGACLGLFATSLHFAKNRRVSTSQPSAIDVRSDSAKLRKRKKKSGAHLASNVALAESECLSAQEVSQADRDDGTQASELQIPAPLTNDAVDKEVDHENPPSVLENTERVAKLMAKKAERKARKAQEMLEARAREDEEKEKAAAEAQKIAEANAEKEAKAAAEAQKAAEEKAEQEAKAAAEAQKAAEEKIKKEAEAKAAADAAKRAAEEKAKKESEVAEAEEKARKEAQEKSVAEAEKAAKEDAEKAKAKAAAEAVKAAAKKISKKTTEEIDIAEAAKKRVKEEARKETQKQAVADVKTVLRISELVLDEEKLEKDSEKAKQEQRSEMQVEATGSQRTLLEKEILKTEKKLREVAKLKEKIAAGENLAANQLEKVSKAEELSDLLGELRQRSEEASVPSVGPNEDSTLKSMNQKQLRELAKKIKIPDEEMEACYGKKDTKASMIEVIQNRQDPSSQHFGTQHCHSSGSDVGWAPQVYSSSDAYLGSVTHQVQEFRKNGRGGRKSLSTWAKEDGHNAEKRKGPQKPLPDGPPFDGCTMQPIAVQDGWMVSLDGMPRNVASLIESDSSMPSAAVVPYLQQDCQFEPVGDTPWFQVGHDVNACWDWMNQGTCPRGDSCQWHHPVAPAPAPVFWDNEHNSIYPKYSPGYDFTDFAGSNGS